MKINRDSETWQAVSGHIEERLVLLTSELESLTLMPERTMQIRGAIYELRWVLGLAEQPPAMQIERTQPYSK